MGRLISQTKLAPRPRAKSQWQGFLYLVPFLIPYVLFTFVMLLASFGLSFTDYKIMGGQTHFIAFDNYDVLFTDSIYWQAVKNTFLFVGASTPPLILFPLLIAILIEHRLLAGRGFFRTTFFAPYVLPVSVVAYTFLYLFQPYTGLVNNILKLLGVLGGEAEIYWLKTTSLAWVTVIFETMWWTCGFNMILYIAGMQEIPEQYYESADIDGAGYLKKVWYITLPLLGRVHVTVLFLQLVASFKVFGQIYLLTMGGPGGDTRAYIQYLYEVGFRTFKIGRASAAALVLFLIIMTISFLQFSLTSRLAKD